jgi:hypothetical protein
MIITLNVNCEKTNKTRKEKIIKLQNRNFLNIGQRYQHPRIFLVKWGTQPCVRTYTLVKWGTQPCGRTAGPTHW